MMSHVTFIACLLLLSRAEGQITENNVDIRIKNDNAGQLSEWLQTGDDLGETHSFSLSANLLKISKLYNFGIKIESTEYATLNRKTREPRDILFTELNNVQLSFDNNKFQNNAIFYSCTAGLYHLQGNKITIGATGQKHFFHNIFNNLYDNYWIYVSSDEKELYIPHGEMCFGHNKTIFKKANVILNTINNIQCRVASDFRYSGIGAKSYFNLRLINEGHYMHAIDIELEGYYLTNIEQYHTFYLQTGARLNFKHFVLYLHLNKPLSKYLTNPLIKSDDLELLFIYGFAYLF
jgi:hypothetical protein